jgi:predicted alpha/beta-fold hydrolase
LSAARFAPARLVRNRHLQSFLASTRLRRPFVGAGALERASSRRLLDCGAGVTLEGFLAEPATPRGLVVLLHGWEGSARSTYVLSCGARLFRSGLAVFRLNLRDHGGTHALNPELFHCCRIDEVVGALRAVAAGLVTRPLSLVGFSLGGNFALRVALRAPAAGVPLARAVAVCPVIDPARALRRIEQAPAVYERHLRTKWHRSLRAKQRLFPERYDFETLLRGADLRETTRRLVERYTDFGRLERYLEGYSVAGARLAELRLPAAIVAAADDPLLPVADLQRLASETGLRPEIHDLGGHCGFVETPRLRSWIDGRVAALLAESGA